MERLSRRTLLVGLGLSACVRPQRALEADARQRVQGREPPNLDALLAQMTLEEKIGQMTQADLKALERESDVETYLLGSLLSGGDSLVEPNRAERWADTYDRLQRYALGTRLGIPLLYGIDAVHGHNAVHGAVIFPHNVGLGATRDPELVERVARATAEEVAGTGLDWTFAPCIAVPRDERWGRTYEGFGESAELATLFAPAAVRGLQTSDLASRGAVLACAKHFVGDGGTRGGKDRGDTVVDERELREVHLAGYRAAVAAGVGSVMASYSSWNGEPMHGNRRLISEVLKGELGFEGFVVTDWEGIDQMSGSYAEVVERAINAGIDMVMVPKRYRLFIDTLRSLVQSGRVSPRRIDDAVRRIVRKKIELGLWQRPLTERTLTASIGSDAHRAVAREAVRKSAVLLKNGTALPLARGKRVHVGGAKADDLGLQCGGWTVSWMGKRGRTTQGTSVLEALRAAFGPELVSHSADGRGGDEAAAAIAVIGEEPYAEWKGDRADLTVSSEDLTLVRSMKRSGRPLIVVLVTGRPLILDSVLADADALLVVWLPGSEGAGIADVLTGDHAPTGKLPHTWPRAMAQLPINVGDPAYDPLFPYGFGLTYAV
jgi:beta-glucosidase